MVDPEVPTVEHPGVDLPAPVGAPPPVSGPLRRRLRWPLLAVILVVDVLALLSAPVGATPDDLAADLGAGRVRVAQVGQLEPTGWMLPGFPGRQVDASAPRRAIRWTTIYGATYQVPVSRLPVTAPQQLSDQQVVDLVAATATAAGRAAPRVSTARLTDTPDHLAAAAFLAWLLILAMMMLGPEPRRCTRFGWFWLLGIPGGFGLAWFLLREAPWSREAVVLQPLPPGKVRRRPGEPRLRWGGWSTFLLLSTLAAFGVVVLDQLVSGLLGHHPGTSIPWQLGLVSPHR